jgi:hypothetical protein
MQLMGHMVNPFLVLKGTASLFSRVAVPFYIAAAMHACPVSESPGLYLFHHLSFILPFLMGLW